MNSESVKRVCVLFCLVILIGFLYLFFQARDTNERTDMERPGNGNSPQNLTVEPLSPSQASEESKQPKNSITKERIRENLETLQKLLDDEETQEEALELALKMSEADYEQRIAAIDALNWIGGHEAKMALVKQLDYGGNVTENAMQALVHQFQDDAQDTEHAFDEEAFVAALYLLGETERKALFIILCGYPTGDCARVLITLMDSQDEGIRKLAFESFESVAEGMEIQTKADAEEWLKNYLAENKEDD